MKKRRHLIAYGLLFVLALYGCGGSSLPQGARKIGRYEGTFTTALFNGICQVDLYRLPDGSGTFEGYFQAINEDYFFSMKGELTGYTLEGTFSGEGLFGGSTISGVLARDKNSMSGTFALDAPDSPKGTWKAKRK